MSSINTHLLPKSLRQLVRALGESMAFRLVEMRRGRRLTVPKTLTPGHPLIEEHGLQMAAALVDAYAGLTLDLPKFDSVFRQIRHERVRQLRGDGLNMDEIGAVVGYSRRQVISILQGTPEDRALAKYQEQQQDMFPAFGLDDAPVLANQANDPFNLAAKP